MKIYDTKIDDEIILNLISSIRKKREFSSLDPKKISEELQKYLSVNKKITQVLGKAESFEKISRSKEVSALIKHVRSRFHRSYALFQSRDAPKRKEILNELEKSIKAKGIYDSQDQFISLLNTHVSSKERIGNYESFYSAVFLITGKPKSILDIGCGINPIAYPFMGIKDVVYYACDISQDDMDFLNDYFDMMRKHSGLDGTAFAFDIKKEKIDKEADVVFAFKLIDLIDSKSAEKLLNAKCRFLVASFSTRTISRKAMKNPRRSSFQKMLRRLEKKYTTKTIGDEIIYIIDNTN